MPMLGATWLDDILAKAAATGAANAEPPAKPRTTEEQIDVADRGT